MLSGVARYGNREFAVLLTMLVESYSRSCNNFHYTSAIREEPVVVAAVAAATVGRKRRMIEASPPRVTEARTAGSSN